MRAAERTEQQRRVVKHMSLSHADFFRVLPSIVNGARHKIDGNAIHIEMGQGAVEIRLSAESSRQLSALRLPSTRVELIFRGCAEDAVQAFLDNFDLRFRRGGG